MDQWPNEMEKLAMATLKELEADLEQAEELAEQAASLARWEEWAAHLSSTELRKLKNGKT